MNYTIDEKKIFLTTIEKNCILENSKVIGILCKHSNPDIIYKVALETLNYCKDDILLIEYPKEGPLPSWILEEKAWLADGRKIQGWDCENVTNLTKELIKSLEPTQKAIKEFENRGNANQWQAALTHLLAIERIFNPKFENINKLIEKTQFLEKETPKITEYLKARGQQWIDVEVRNFNDALFPARQTSLIQSLNNALQNSNTSRIIFLAGPYHGDRQSTRFPDQVSLLLNVLSTTAFTILKI